MCCRGQEARQASLSPPCNTANKYEQHKEKKSTVKVIIQKGLRFPLLFYIEIFEDSINYPNIISSVIIIYILHFHIEVQSISFYLGIFFRSNDSLQSRLRSHFSFFFLAVLIEFSSPQLRTCFFSLSLSRWNNSDQVLDLESC